MKDFIKRKLNEYLVREMTKGGTYNVFHGSPHKITNFVVDFVGGEDANDLEGPGIYFSNNRDNAMMYGDNVHAVQLNPRMLLDASPINEAKLRPLVTKLAKMAPEWEDHAANHGWPVQVGLRNFVESTFKYNENEKDCILQTWIDFYRYEPVQFVNNCVKLGIDGIIVEKENNIKHFIIYNPSIIKMSQEQQEI